MHSGRWQWRGPFLEYCRLAHTQPSLQNSQPHSVLVVLSTGYLATFKIWLGCICFKRRNSVRKIRIIFWVKMLIIAHLSATLLLQGQLIPLLLAKQTELHRVCRLWVVFGSDLRLVFQSPSPIVWTGTWWGLKIYRSVPGLSLISGCPLAGVLMTWRHKTKQSHLLLSKMEFCINN